MQEKKARGPRRSRAEIEADLRRRLARSEWAGVRESIRMAEKAAELLEEAQAAAGERGQSNGFAAAASAVRGLIQSLGAIVPEDGR